MKELVNIKILALSLFLVLSFNTQAQNDEEVFPDMQEQMQELQKQMENMLQGLGEQGEGNSFFFSDTIFNELGNIPLDSMMQSLSFAIPEMLNDSMMLRGFDLNGGMFGNRFQDQLNQMFESLDGFDPEYFMDLEELKHQLEQNGIRPDDFEREPKKPGQKKKKVYKI